MAIFNEKIEIREQCKGMHCVDLGEGFPCPFFLIFFSKQIAIPTSIDLQIWLRYSRDGAL